MYYAISEALLLYSAYLPGSWAFFNPLRHSGPASPYFDAPSVFGIPFETPAGCIVEKAAYIVRHGARFPEPGSFQGWQSLFAKFQNATYVASGPLSFIPSWVPPIDDQPHEPLFMTSAGANEAFSLGAQLRQRYGFTKGGDNLTVWTAGQQRVIDTATHFLRGYLSQGDYLSAPEFNRGNLVILPDSVNTTGADSLTASAACPAYSGNDGTSKSNAFRATYQNGIANRLNRFLDGLVLDATDIGVMQDLCGFSFVINGDRRFCDIFQENEWLDYEYAHDLNYYYGSGPGNNLAATTAFPWVKAITNLLVAETNSTVENGSFNPSPLLMGFTHDNNIPPVIAALGLLNSSQEPGVFPLSPTTPDPRRTFRASHLVNFLGHISLERLSCEAPLAQSVQHIIGQLVPIPGNGVHARKFVRIRVNNAPVPIPSCTSGPGASCPLADFAHHVNGQLAARAGDFVERCGLTSVVGAPDVVDFYVDPESKLANTTQLLLVIDVPGGPST